MPFMENTFAFTFNMDEGAQKRDRAAHEINFKTETRPLHVFLLSQNTLKKLKAKIKILVAFVMLTLLIIWRLVVY
jgi:hypothetical protein